MRLTIDASVIGDIMFEDCRTAGAAAYLSAGFEMFAPAVLDSELISTATKRHRVFGVAAEIARHRWRSVRHLAVTRIPDALVADSAFDLAIALRHPSNDCLYLATAIAYDAPLVTGDRALYDKAHAAGLGDHVLWVEDPPPAE